MVGVCRSNLPPPQLARRLGFHVLLLAQVLWGCWLPRAEIGETPDPSASVNGVSPSTERPDDGTSAERPDDGTLAERPDDEPRDADAVPADVVPTDVVTLEGRGGGDSGAAGSAGNGTGAIPAPPPCANCSSGIVPGGTFFRDNASAPATVSSFALDLYEVTVGGWRAFADALSAGWVPAAGSGKNPGSAADPGWDVAWNSSISSTPVVCDTNSTWARGIENGPMNCINWYEAFAFCVWDGGRLPSEAEWNYAAAGGGDAEGQRVYPWSNPPSSTSISALEASYGCGGDGVAGCRETDLVSVGTKPSGNGRWGHADLAGNVWEWTIDYFAIQYPVPCIDCANFSVGDYAQRVFRGGGYEDDASRVGSSARDSNSPEYRAVHVGVRCARNAP